MYTRQALSSVLILAALPLVGAEAAPERGAHHVTLSAQQQGEVRPWRVIRGQGWLGVELVQETGAVPGRVHIASLVPGSPADRAGLRAGDILLSVDGETASPTVLGELSRELEPGSRIRFEVERNGESRVVAIQAVQRPFPFGPEGSPFSPDSINRLVRLHIDSMRLDMEARGYRALMTQDVMETAREGLTVRFDTLRFGPTRQGVETRTYHPLVRGENRVDTLVAVVRGTSGEPSVARVVTIRGTTDRLTTAAPPPQIAVRGMVPARAGAVVSLGQRVVAGAELMELNPGLATYFGVEKGVLVMEVLERTPAHEAGLRPGDVIVGVDGDAVTEVPEVRALLARGYASPPVSVRIVREGSERVLEFSR